MTFFFFVFFFFNDTATTEIYTILFVGSVRWGKETDYEKLVYLASMILRRANAADYRVQLNELKIGIAAGADDPQLGRNPLLPRSIRLSAWLTLHMPRLWQWACRNFLKDRQ